MVDEQEVRKDTYEMIRNAEGTAMFFSTLINSGKITKTQLNAFLNFFLANDKRQIELNPFISQEQKKVVIQYKEHLTWLVKQYLGL